MRSFKTPHSLCTFTGKSTLSRFLLHAYASVEEDADDCTCDLPSGVYSKHDDTNIGWVSTESHLGRVVDDEKGESSATAWNVMSHDGTVPDKVVETMVQWVFGDNAVDLSALKDRPLQELSQGQQKLVFIASALAFRPNLLILDEPTQALDWVNRRRVLALLERICQATEDRLSLVYITHYQEEWIPSISHVLHLDQGHAVFQGVKKDFYGDMDLQ